MCHHSQTVTVENFLENGRLPLQTFLFCDERDKNGLGGRNLYVIRYDLCFNWFLFSIQVPAYSVCPDDKQLGFL